MRFNTGSGSLTRCVVDGEHTIDLGELHTVMQRIHGALEPLVPESQRSYVGEALLSFALRLENPLSQAPLR